MIKTSICRPYRLQVMTLLAFLLVLPATVGAAEPFPTYECLRANVSFWKDIYSRYSLNQGIIHDSDNLDIVYDVIDLVDEKKHNSRKINIKRNKQARQKYRNILLKFANGKKPATAEEKRVFELFGENASRRIFKTAAENVRMQKGQKDRFRQGIISSGAYLEAIKKEFNDHGLPEDLAYLAHVESSFNVKAYSKFGAAGIWQFTRSTGRRFMRVDYTIDERRDPFIATHAAALYLKENHKRLGNWPLAMTAYNHGANGIARAVREQGSYQEIFKNYDSRIFGFASRNFYSEFLAARHVAKNYRKYFGELELDRPQRYYEFKLEGYLPLEKLASHFQIDIATIASLNPALRNPIYNGQKYVPPGYRLRLPARGDRMAALANEIPTGIYFAKQKPSRFYEVRRGDTAGIIARRHDISLHALIMANQLNSRATVFVGQNLRIPVNGEEISPSRSYAKSNSKKRTGGSPRIVLANRSKIRVTNPVTTTGLKTMPVPQAAAPTTDNRLKFAELPMAASHYPGDHSSFIKNEPASIDIENLLAASHSAITDSLDIATEPETLATVNTAVVYGHLTVEKITGKGKKRRGTIQVEVGETLGHYAEWLGVRAQDLRRINGLHFRTPLRLNQQLKIPLAKVDREQFEEQRFEYHKEIEEDFFSAYRIEEMRPYQIKKGDNIWELSNNEFEVPFWLIKKYNADKNFNGLRPDQQLLVPIVERLEDRLTTPGLPSHNTSS